MEYLKFLKFSLLTTLLTSAVYTQSQVNLSRLTYENISKCYKTDERKVLYEEVLKGGWPELVDDENYKNTCAIRMSIALNCSDLSLTKEFSDGNLQDGNGKYICLKVPTIFKFLEEKLGTPWGMSKNPGQEFSLKDNLPDGKGIVLDTFPEDASAFGHVDLWNGKECKYNCPELDANDAATVAFWKLD